MMKKGLIHLYIGKGKGKTTSAVGLAVRACGCGRRVCLVRFLKPAASSEIISLRKLGIIVISLKEYHPFFYKSASMEKLKMRVAHDMKTIKSLLFGRKFDLIILDEILCLLGMKVLKEKDLLDLINAKRGRTELVLTGWHAPASVKRRADYISTIIDTRHPFKSGLAARKGIEY